PAFLQAQVSPFVFVATWAVLVWMAPTRASADDLAQPIRVSPDGHFLVQPDGKPFFWLQDWGYELFKIPDRNEVDRYFADRSRKGFNIVMAPVTGMTEDPNLYGERPFVDNDPTRPNPRYFANVDWIIDRAAHYGLRIALLPCWGHAITGSWGGTSIFDAHNAE